jgi:hypothetical protein
VSICTNCKEEVRWPDGEPAWSPCCGAPLADSSVTILSPRDVPQDHLVVVSGSPVIVHRVADSLVAIRERANA